MEQNQKFRCPWESPHLLFSLIRPVLLLVPHSEESIAVKKNSELYVIGPISWREVKIALPLSSLSLQNS